MLLDPNTLAADGTASLATYAFSECVFCLFVCFCVVLRCVVIFLLTSIMNDVVYLCICPYVGPASILRTVLRAAAATGSRFMC